MKRTLLLLLMAACMSAVAQTAPADSIGKCNGSFSVSPTTKVRFSPGNLQYQTSELNINGLSVESINKFCVVSIVSKWDDFCIQSGEAA